MTIYRWDDPSGPYLRGAGTRIIEVNTMVNRSIYTPVSGGRSGGFTGTSGTSINPENLVFEQTPYWGLKQKSERIWQQYRIWVVSAYYGLPKTVESDTKNTGLFAFYYDGTWTTGSTKDQYGHYPVFKKYCNKGDSYFEMLTVKERNYFPVGKGLVNQQPNPSPSSSPPQIPPTTGSGSGVGSTTGVLPPGMFIPDLSDWLGELNFPPSQSTNNPGTNPNTRPGTNPGGPPKTGGQYVTGPDGKRYWLPPNIDFEGLKREYDRRNPKPETKIVVRMPKGYAAPKVTNGSKPRMTQIQLDLTESGRAIGTVTKTFVFPYIPQNIRYSDIGSDWQEIPRALNAPLLDWNRYKLLKVSMDFLVAAQFKPGGPTQIDTVSDGLFNSVTGELNLLREMATNKFPVYLEGFDDILQVQMKRSRYEAPKGMQFVINDLNITAGRRTVDPNTGLATTPSLIAAAQVSMTLTEIPIETVTLVKLPPLDLGTPLVGKPGDGSGGGIPSLGLQSSTLTGLKWTLTPE